MDEHANSLQLSNSLIAELRRLRKEKGLSQKALGESIGCKQQVVSRIETFEDTPTLKTLQKMANALDVDIKIVPRHR